MTEERRDDLVTMYKTMRGSTERISEQMMERASSPTDIWGIPTGFKLLDKFYLHGIQQEEMMVVLARPGVGKSAFAGKIALSVAKWFKSTNSNKRVRLISLEMSFDAWNRRLASYISGISAYKAESGFVSVKEQDEYNVALEQLAKLPIDCIDSDITMDGINKFVRQDNTTGLFIVDHIGISPGTDGAGNTYSAIAAASGLYRELSRSVSPSIILSQMNKRGEDREDKRPSLGDIFGADRIAQDARKVIGLYRPDFYKRLSTEQMEEPQPSEIIVLKNNNGRIGVVDAVFHPKRMDWTEVEEETK